MARARGLVPATSSVSTVIDAVEMTSRSAGGADGVRASVLSDAPSPVGAPAPPAAASVDDCPAASFTAARGAEDVESEALLPHAVAPITAAAIANAPARARHP